MDTYQTLRRLCTIWSLLALTVGFLIGAAGGIDLVNGRVSGAAYIVAALVMVLFAQTLSEFVSLVIDIAISLRRIARQGETPPTIRKLQKD